MPAGDAMDTAVTTVGAGEATCNVVRDTTKDDNGTQCTQDPTLTAFHV
jgi:hypothetical protein